MKYQYFTASVRGFFQRALSTPRTSVVLAVVLILLGLGGAVGLTFAGAPTASAGSTCVSNPGYTLPSTLSLSGASNGLTVQDEGVSTYSIGGTSVGAIRDALDSCAPRFNGANSNGEYLAYTSYALSWQYDTEMLPDGTCTLSNVKVGLHLTQLMPKLTNGAISPSLQNRWNSFISGLQEHEDGHKTLDIAKAQGLLSSLTTLRMPCNTIEVSISRTTTSALQGFITANAEHDTDTHYGRDQGAIW